MGEGDVEEVTTGARVILGVIASALISLLARARIEGKQKLGEVAVGNPVV